ncbi:CLUMA_CG015996, isoform A [Clunio marinus]|uniref:CLUMA_CG015996, isoform A n=1 Tax=Clunio marinus TaxID=568069 RepID=A0A1J1IRN1_9DIPT|nr:CLUMA_CG015996, isoform A [Clunio marinus]
MDEEVNVSAGPSGKSDFASGRVLNMSNDDCYLEDVLLWNDHIVIINQLALSTFLHENKKN